jgi:hypothetical protein
MHSSIRSHLYDLYNEMPRENEYKKRVLEVVRKLDNIISQARIDIQTKEHTHILIKLFQDV